GHEVTKEHYQTLLDSQAVTIPTLAGFNAEGLPEAPMLMQQYPATTSFGGAGPSFMSPTVYSPETTPRWGKKGEQKRPVPAKVCTSIVDGLKQVYNSKVKPLEEAFGNFFSPLLNDSDFEAKPSVLLLGQYSTGKTTFIKYLLGRDYPGSHIGPEPTTDRFVVVYHGLEERRVPGNTLAVQPDKPYQGLASFGTGFLSRFEGSQCPARLLEEITLVDTPGVLSGEKQRIERSYNFVEIARWFAARCDLIFLLFDPYKLDISDEFKQVLPDQARPRLGCTAGVCPFRVITAMRGHDDKVRVILNKADQVDQQQLMRVYGALMWSLGKVSGQRPWQVFRSPEVCRVYVGSFNSDAPISEAKNPYGRTLFEAEQKELLASLYDIPQKLCCHLSFTTPTHSASGCAPGSWLQRSCDRKINEFVKRVRACKMHLLLVGHLRKQMPSMFGKEAAQKKLLQDLPAQFTQVWPVRQSQGAVILTITIIITMS
ncbi:hypothetical protein QJQ45_028265, partial [Haematococcus lacustris]